MATFEYVALDREGRRVRGSVEGDTGRQARQILRDGGLTLLSIEAVASERAGPHGRRRYGARLGTKQLALFTRLLASLLQAGLPLEEALTAITAQSESASLRRVVASVRGQVLEGHSLGGSLEAFPNAFPEIYRSTVQAGEQTRHLPTVLERLAQHMEEREALNQRLQVAMVYPALLVTTSVLIVAGLLGYVVPEITRVFENLHRELPYITRALIALSEATRRYGLYALLGLMTAIVGLRHALRHEGPRRLRDRLFLRLPLVRGLVRDGNAARIARSLAVLLESGLPLVEALTIAARATTSLPVRDLVLEAERQVREGRPLHRALAQGGLLPPLLLHLIASGEAGGNLVQMLDTAARAHEHEVQSRVGLMMAVVEPALILVMGLIVLGIVLAILLPIFELNQLV